MTHFYAYTCVLVHVGLLCMGVFLLSPYKLGSICYISTRGATGL